MDTSSDVNMSSADGENVVNQPGETNTSAPQSAMERTKYPIQWIAQRFRQLFPKKKRRLYLLNPPKLKLAEKLNFSLAADTSNPASAASIAKINAYKEEQKFVTPAVLKVYREKYKHDELLWRDVETTINFLNEQLIPIFYEQDYEAGRFQNAYYLYQWTLTFLAWVSALASFALIGFFSQAIWIGAFLGVLSILIAGITALTQNGKQQVEWYLHRRRAEQLRREYFACLLHMAPHDNEDVEYVLGKRVVDIKTGSPLPASSDEDKLNPNLRNVPRALIPAELALPLFELYRTLRIDSQLNYYENRKDAHKSNEKFTFGGVLAISVATGVASILAGLLSSGLLALFAIILPTLAAVLVAFQRIYGWPRQRILFESTHTQLERARASFNKNADDKVKALLNTALQVEEVLSAEANQWGQEVLDQAPQDKLTAEQLLDGLIEKHNLSQQQRKDIKTIIDPIGTPPKP